MTTVRYPQLLSLTIKPSMDWAGRKRPMSLYEQIVYRTICDIYTYTRAAARTAIIAGRLGKNDRVIRRTLVSLEAAQYIRRRKQRGGWLPNTTLRLPDPITRLTRAA